MPNEKGGMETMYELRGTLFWETESTIHTGHSPSPRIACWWTKGEQSSRASHRRDGLAGGDKRKGRVLCRGSLGVGEERQREKNAHGGN